MHAVMGIVYGAFLVLLYPNAANWWKTEPGFQRVDYGLQSWVLTIFAIGVFSSGLRDFAASRRLSG